MEFKIFFEWDSQCGLSLTQMYPFREGLERFFTDRFYGSSIARIGVVVICKEISGSQRKRYKKDKKDLEFDVILDFFSVGAVAPDQKKNLIKGALYETTNEMLQKYKFGDFDTKTFLLDLESISKTLVW